MLLIWKNLWYKAIISKIFRPLLYQTIFIYLTFVSYKHSLYQFYIITISIYMKFYLIYIHNTSSSSKIISILYHATSLPYQLVVDTYRQYITTYNYRIGNISSIYPLYQKYSFTISAFAKTYRHDTSFISSYINNILVLCWSGSDTTTI